MSGAPSLPARGESLPARVESRPTTRARLREDVGDLLAAGYRLVLVAGENVAAPAGSGAVAGTAAVRVGYLLARPAPLGEHRVEVVLEVPTDDPWLPTVADLSYPGGRFEREIRDLFGVDPQDHPLPRRLVRHAHWPRGWHPLLGEDPGPVPDFADDGAGYPFLEVGGDGVYEIPVGPVHAGLIEPGHFRFSVVGETIVRMKARLWYLHRGVERLFEGRDPADGIALAERISGDTAVGHSVAYALACEEALGIEVPEQARLVRALLLELERMHCHAADLGMVLNDVAFGLANVHLQRVRENLLRLNDSVTGHRLLRDGVTLGGARLAGLPDVSAVRAAAADVAEVVRLALEHPMVVDRLVATAVLGRQDAERMGTLGYVARASGVDVDARRDHPFVEPDAAAFAGPVVETTGDVRARFAVRAREVAASAETVVDLVGRLGADVVGRDPGVTGAGSSGAGGVGGAVGAVTAGVVAAQGVRRGLGIVEAWRGLLAHRVTVGADGRLARVKVVDPSFMNWPALPVALADTIVPDFPLANKSFNQSYAGNDL